MLPVGQCLQSPALQPPVDAHRSGPTGGRGSRAPGLVVMVGRAPGSESCGGEAPILSRFYFILFYFILFYFTVFLGLHLRHMELPQLGVGPELQLPAYTTATAILEPSPTDQDQGSNPSPRGSWSGSFPLSHSGNAIFYFIFALRPSWNHSSLARRLASRTGLSDAPSPSALGGAPAAAPP